MCCLFVYSVSNAMSFTIHLVVVFDVAVAAAAATVVDDFVLLKIGLKTGGGGVAGSRRK